MVVQAIQPYPVASASPPMRRKDRFRMAFHSILYERSGLESAAPPEAPEYFRDLNLDQIVAAITAGKDEYDLKPFFHQVLKSVDAVAYRHEVMRDLENGPLLTCIKVFAGGMRKMRERLAQANKLYYKYHKQRWFLHAIEAYCEAVRELDEALSHMEMSSRGFESFRVYVAAYASSEVFRSLVAETKRLCEAMSAIQYSILIKDGGFTVSNYGGEHDYSVEVADTFQKFQQGSAKNYRVDFRSSVDMNHIEAKVLEFVALLNEDVFSDLDSFFVANQGAADVVLVKFDREVQFYVSYIDYMSAFRRAGLRFCYPEVSAIDKDIHDEEGFDLALATKLVASKTPIVCNSFHLTGSERVFVVSGPNQGGKTTFARAFGQLHHLAAIGCLVPGKQAKLFLFDSLFVHFEREENIKNLHGKLQDDLIRIHGILQRATPRSIVIMNEIFTSTTLKDAVFLARKVIEQILELDLVCVCVTFLEEMASLSEKTVSMVSTIVPDNPAMRTFKVVRRAADGLSYAISIAEKYRVTYECLRERMPQ
jgi:hypothetical protein